MPYDISVPDGSDYVEIKWHGHATMPEIQRSGVDGLKSAAQWKVWKVLIDISEIENQLNTIDLFSTTVEHSRLDPPGPRAVMLGRTDQAKELAFVENVGSNRGMLIKSFTAKNDALEWLMK